MPQRFDDEHVREVLARAEEIHQQELLPLDIGPQMQEVVQAAEESGLSRSAVMQALRERVSAHRTPPEPGELVFAPSEEGDWYAAELVAVDKGQAKVRFLGGSDARFSLEELRPFQMLPGQQVQCPWPDWGWCGCTVVSYDRENRKVRLSDFWGSEYTFHLSDVYVEPPKPRKEPLLAALRARATLALVSAGLVAGGAIGALVTWLLLR